MPRPWKLSGGASAQQRADKLRSRSDKLARQATAWESGADLEPSVRRKLDELPPSFTVLHELTLPGEAARLDHLVIGSGGLYLVDAKRYSGRLVYSKKMLWHGRFPIADKLETLVWEAETLSTELGHEVVPVMCFVDPVLPQPVTTLGAVIVCRVSVLHTIVRSTHATMSAAEVARLVDVASRFAADRRGGSASAPFGAGHAATGWLPGDELDANWSPTADDTQAYVAAIGADTATINTGPVDVSALGRADEAAGGDGDVGTDLTADAAASDGSADATGSTPLPTAAISTIPPIGPPGQIGRPRREPRDRRWPRRLVFSLVGTVLVVAAVLIVWKVSSDTEKTARDIAAHPTTTTAAPTTTTVPETDPATTSTTTLESTQTGFSAACPIPGAGWQLRPTWPGKLADLAWYDYAYQDFDLTYKQFALMTAPDSTNYTILAVPPGNTRTIRVRPVFANGDIGDSKTMTWTAPSEAC